MSASTDVQVRSPLSPDHARLDRSDQHEMSLLQIVNVLLRHRWWVLGVPFLGFAVAVVLTFAKPRMYKAEGSFLPQRSGSGSSLSGVAAQLGLTIGDNGDLPPLDFYATLLRSSALLDALADSSLVIGGRSQSLVSLLGIDTSGGQSAAIVHAMVVNRLRSAITVDADPRTGIVGFGVTTNDPILSAEIGAKLLQKLDAFTLESRRERAATERRFTEERLNSAERDLRAAEERLQEFLEHNRSYQADPQLSFEYGRFERVVRLKEQIYTSLAQTLEQASIESTRNTPTISVVDHPVAPAFPESRHLVVRAIVGLLLGLIVGLFAAFVREYLVVRRNYAPAEFSEFVELRGETSSDLRHPFRAIRNALFSK